MDEVLVRVGDRVRNIRKSKGITQEELAERSSLHSTYIGKVERGEKNLTLETCKNYQCARNTLGRFLFYS